MIGGKGKGRVRVRTERRESQVRVVTVVQRVKEARTDENRATIKKKQQ